MTEIASLDLDTTITRDQYMNAVTRLLIEANTVSSENGWCDERHRYFEAVVKEYDLGDADFSQVPEDTDYAAQLRSMRARILWYAYAASISLDTANRFFAAMGLHEYNDHDKPGSRFHVEVIMELNVTGEGGRYYLQSHLASLITRALDGRLSEEDNRYVPGSAVITQRYVTSMLNEPAIKATDIERPSYS
jgi:hypothetical protein